MTDAIEVDHLVKRYGELPAVAGIDFTVRAGTVFAFLGPNGAGKTTTTEIIATHGRPERLRFDAGPGLADYLRSRLPLSVRAADGRVEVELHEKTDALRTLSAVEASGLPWQNFATVQDTLEDVFVRLVGQMDDGALKQEARS